METLETVLLCCSTVVALAARAAMKRFVARKGGKAEAELLEIDVWRLSSGELPARLLLALELLAWAGTVFLVAALAATALR
jgi:hypothetical protein